MAFNEVNSPSAANCRPEAALPLHNPTRRPLWRDRPRPVAQEFLPIFALELSSKVVSSCDTRRRRRDPILKVATMTQHFESASRCPAAEMRNSPPPRRLRLIATHLSGRPEKQGARNSIPAHPLAHPASAEDTGPRRHHYHRRPTLANWARRPSAYHTDRASNVMTPMR